MNITQEGVQLELFERTPKEQAEIIFHNCGTVIELQNATSDRKYSKEVQAELLRLLQTDPRVKNLPEGL